MNKPLGVVPHDKSQMLCNLININEFHRAISNFIYEAQGLASWLKINRKAFHKCDQPGFFPPSYMAKVLY